MTPGAIRKFESVTRREGWGAVDAEGFHLHDHPRAASGSLEFGVCSIDGQQIAVFVVMAIPVESRASLASRKPDWLDAVVRAEVVSALDAAVAVIDAELLSPNGAELERCAFATACIAFDAGSFKVVPESYSIRFGARGSVRVTMNFDDDSDSWAGGAEVQFHGV